jgi:subtilase family serine protease
VLASLRVAPVGAGAERTATVTLVVPPETAAGVYYVVAEADAGREVEEGDEANNSVGTPLAISRVAGGPDLVVTEASAPGAAAPGSRIRLRCTVENQGGERAVSARVRFYLSADETRERDVYLGSRPVVALAPGERRVVDLALRIPPRTQIGTRYLLIVASDRHSIDDVHAEAIVIR